VLDGWLVTRYDLAVAVMRDPERFTVDDARFSTARVIGPSMLSLDGAEHARHRTPFVAPFRAAAVDDRFAAPVAAEAERLLAAIDPAGRAELRRSFAGPLATAIVTRALGLEQADAPAVLGFYDAIVASVTEITAGTGGGAAGRQAYDALAGRLAAVIERGDPRSLLGAAAAHQALTDTQVSSNAAVLLFGGIETTEGMIVNALQHLLERPDQLALVRADRALLAAAIEESLRLEPAAGVVDRYATADVALGGAQIARGELVRVSITAANRDPHVFGEPDRFDLTRSRGRSHVAFAHGPHVCVGVHLARLEARVALHSLLTRFPHLRLDPAQPPPAITGLVFRKSARLDVAWGE
jgi:cytochrome P450